MQTFWKLHGAGNDFILLDDRDRTFPTARADSIRTLCDRRTGIGSDGLLLIQSADAPDADLRMRFFNPDGNEADMCGNAARCLARLAVDRGLAANPMTIETRAGPIRATVHANGAVTVAMPAPSPVQACELDLDDGRPLAGVRVNTGVPHAVFIVEDLAATPVATLGAAIRRHPDFAPAGTNVDFVAITGPAALAIRTYERGVEAETAACGTGITAAALAAADAGAVKPPVRVTTAGGDTLTVNFERRGSSVVHVTLTGPAVYVFEGHLAPALENALRAGAGPV